MIQSMDGFKDTTRLFYSNDEVANYNFEKLSQLQHPLATVNALHSSDAAKKISSDDMSGLEPIFFLQKGHK